MPFPEWKRLLLLAAIAAVAYGLLQNGQWAAGGADDAYYLSVAANLLKGRGYTWNGVPALLVTPGWPLVLAGAMRISPSFALLNLLPLGIMVASSLAWYFVLRRLTTPWRAFAVTAGCVVLFEWHRQACSPFSDSLDILLLAVSLLLALQIQSGRSAAWRLPLLALSCVAMVVARYTGALMLPLVLGAVLGGQLRPRLNRQWLAAAVVVLAMIGAFFGMRTALHRYAEAQLAAASTEDRAMIVAAINDDEDVQNHSLLIYPRAASGLWLPALFWPPIAVLESRPLEKRFVEVAGWGLLLVFLAMAWRTLLRREWLWAGAAIAMYVLISRPQNHTVSRYLAPLAPLIALGIWSGVECLVPVSWPAFGRKTVLAALAVLAVSAVACNLAILGVNVWAIRSDRFEKVWLAGEYDEALRLGAYLSGQRLQNGELAVAVRYDDPVHRQSSRWIHRAVCLLTDRTVTLAPKELVTSDPSPELLAWARQQKVRFVITRPAASVRRIWHVRLSPPPAATDPDDPAPTSYYVLYEVREDGWARVSLPEVSDGLRTVPGL